MPKVISDFAKNATALIVSMFALAFMVTVSYGEEQGKTIAELAKANINAVVIITDGLGGQGSGFIIDDTGIIVTNYHVIRGNSASFVKLPDGSKYLVKSIINFDPKKDIAIIKINGWNLPTVSLGDSNKVQIGDQVVAIGSPQELENTVSDGLVSSKREIEPGFNILQVTTPISSGSSGGALFNLSGEVIGITFASLPSGQNLNFAVPINYVRTMLQVAMPGLLKDSGKIAKRDAPEKQASGGQGGIEGMQQIEKLRQDYEEELSEINAEIAPLLKDSVRLKWGYEAVGSIIEKKDDSVTIETESGARMTFQMAQVDSIKQISGKEAEKLEALKAKRQGIIEKYENQFRAVGLIKYKGDWITDQEYRALLAEKKRKKELEEFKKKRKKELEELKRRELALKYVAAGDEYWNKAVFYNNQISDLAMREQWGAVSGTAREALIWARKALSSYEKAGRLYPRLKGVTEADLKTKIGETKRLIKDLKRLI